jgi:hypothetical protein
MPCPSHYSWFYHSNNIWWGVRTIKLLIVQYLPLPCCLVPLDPQTFPRTLLSNPLSLRSSVNVRVHVSHPYKTTGKIIVTFIFIFMLLESKLEDRWFWTESWKTFPEFSLLLNSPWMRFCVLEASPTMWTLPQFQTFITCLYVVLLPSMLLSRYGRINACMFVSELWRKSTVAVQFLSNNKRTLSFTFTAHLFEDRNYVTAYLKTSYIKTPQIKTPYIKTPYIKTPYIKTFYIKTPFIKTSYIKTPYIKNILYKDTLYKDILYKDTYIKTPI